MQLPERVVAFYFQTDMHRLLLLILMAIVAIPRLAAAEPDSVRRHAPVRAVVASAGSALVINAALTELLKATVDERRPDGRGSDSWPSRHTSWAFTVASVLSHELYDRSPWWVAGAHVAADAVAMQRVLGGRHYPKDVLGGAAVGLVSAELGYMVGRLVFPRSYPGLPEASSDWLPGIDVTTAALFPLSGPAPHMSARTGVMTALRLSLPMAEWWGVAVQTDLRSMPVYTGGGYVDMADGWGISAGMALGASADGRWSPSGRVMLGVVRNFHMSGVPHPGWSFSLEAAGGAMYRLTPQLAVGVEGGYLCQVMRSTVNALSLSIVTRACF